MRYHILFCLLFFSAAPGGLLAQTTAQTSFGKNRVQYHRQFDAWMLYETPNFVTYWYGDARNIAQAALQTAEMDYGYVQQLLEYQTTEKIELLVFRDLTDLKQSNIGEDDVFLLRAGETKVVGNKVFVFFDGDHNHLRIQIREGVSAVLINAMLYGANLQEIVQNAVLLNLPGWFTEGLNGYVGETWNTELDNQLANLLLSGKYKNFDRLAREHPRLAGHALWHYISLHFGQGTVSNLLYLTRINRSVDAGFLYVLGNGYKRTTESMMEYYKRTYVEEKRFMSNPDKQGSVKIRNKKKLPLYQFKLSPDGKQLAFVSNDIGRWRVWTIDLKSGKRKQIYKGGARNALQTTDFNYPQLAWNPDNKRLAVLYERRDQPKLVFIDTENGKKESAILSPEYQRVLGMSFININDLAFSGNVRGYSDLFIYRTNNRQTERITQDFWDDLDPSVAVLDGRRGILFASNRIADTLSNEKLDTLLPLGKFDLFFYDLESRSAELIRLTQTPHINERNPIGVDSTHFYYLSDAAGIHNRSAGRLEPYIAYYQATVYLKDGAEQRALDTRQTGEWPLEKALNFLVPLDSVLVNVDSTQIDSIRTAAIYKKRAITWNQSNYKRNLQEIHSSARAGKYVEVAPLPKKTEVWVRTVEAAQQTPGRITRFREYFLRSAGLPVPDQPKAEPTSDNSNQPETNEYGAIFRERRDTITQVPAGWLFQVPEYLSRPAPADISPQPDTSSTAKPPAVNSNPIPRLPETNKAESKLPEIIEFDERNARAAALRPVRPLLEAGKNNEIIRFIPPQIIPYRLRFRTDYISTSMDNNLLFEGLERYDSPTDRFRTPPPGVLLRANFKDLLEDYVLEAGLRLPTTFNGAEYYLWFDDKKRRIDRRFMLYRRSLVFSVPRAVPAPGTLSPDQQERNNTFFAQYELRYPFTVFTSLRAAFNLRQDKSITLSSDPGTLAQPDYAEQRAAVRLSAVFDNTVDVDLNLKTGTRAKIFLDVVKRFELNTEPKLSLDLNSGFMTIIGLDARHYHRLDRRSILALRVAGAGSFGSEKMLYILGGVDNWVLPRFNEGIPLPQDNGFAYQALATNVRGFAQNIRNGNSYALFSSELRVPIFKYFSKKPVMGNFWRNFQLVGFFDAGTAWEGKSPYRGDNPINSVVLTNPPTVSIRVNYFRDPVVFGYGGGVRMQLFGIFVRADYAWGIETRVVQKPMFHLAMGTDF